MPLPSSPAQYLKKLFHRRTCWMLVQLAEALDYALISVRRLLKEVGYFRSYTHNGKWYTLRDSPDFDRQGLWRYQGIGFSKHGSLTATIAYLLQRSPAGLSAGELSQKLQHPCHAVLSQLHKAGQLDRLVVAGQFRYLATDPRLNRQQREQAARAGLPPQSPGGLSTQVALWVLVEYIKNPGLSFEQIAARLQAERKVAVAPASIERFFQEHALKKRSQHPVEHVAALAQLPGTAGAGKLLGRSVRARTALALSAGPRPVPELRSAPAGLQNPVQDVAHAGPGWLHRARNAPALHGLSEPDDLCAGATQRIGARRLHLRL